MTKRIELRSLINTQPRSEEHGGGPAGQLPPAIAEALPLWDVVAARAGEVLSPLLQAEVTCSVSLSITTHTELRNSDSKPGVLIALDPPERGSLVRFPETSAQMLCTYLLRADGVPQDEELELEELDGLVVMSLIEAISGLIYAAFGIALRRPSQIEPKMIWALTPPPPEARLLADFRVQLGEKEEARMQILFRDTQEHVFAELMNRKDKNLDLRRMELPVTGILSRWTSDTRDLATLAVGERILLPGAELSQVALEATTGLGPQVVAHAELGTIRGRHALRISALRDPI